MAQSIPESALRPVSGFGGGFGRLNRCYVFALIFEPVLLSRAAKIVILRIAGITLAWGSTTCVAMIDAEIHSVIGWVAFAEDLRSRCRNKRRAGMARTFTE